MFTFGSKGLSLVYRTDISCPLWLRSWPYALCNSWNTSLEESKRYLPSELEKWGHSTDNLGLLSDIHVCFLAVDIRNCVCFSHLLSPYGNNDSLLGTVEGGVEDEIPVHQDSCCFIVVFSFPVPFLLPTFSWLDGWISLNRCLLQLYKMFVECYDLKANYSVINCNI